MEHLNLNVTNRRPKFYSRNVILNTFLIGKSKGLVRAVQNVKNSKCGCGGGNRIISYLFFLQ